MEPEEEEIQMRPWDGGRLMRKGPRDPGDKIPAGRPGALGAVSMPRPEEGMQRNLVVRLTAMVAAGG